MGDPGKFRKKYSGPNHPWERTRIEEERELVKKYGLKNKREIWKMKSALRSYKSQAKKLSALKTVQAERERSQLSKKLASYGLIEATAPVSNVLDLPSTAIMERRLQTLIVKKSLARSVKQARQFIVHGHIFVGANKITAPSYLVRVNEESMISFSPTSKLSSAEHPVRVIVAKPKVEKKLEVKKSFDRPFDRRQQSRKPRGRFKGRKDKPHKSEKKEMKKAE